MHAHDLDSISRLQERPEAQLNTVAEPFSSSMNLVSSFDPVIHRAADSCVHEAVLTFAHRTMPPWLQDIKRVIVNTHAMDTQQLIEYFGSLSAEWALECLKVQLPCPHPAARTAATPV